jgi:hypothetical protein
MEEIMGGDIGSKWPGKFDSVLNKLYIKINFLTFKESELVYDCRLNANSVRLVAMPLETDGQVFFFFLGGGQLNPCGHSPYVTSSLMRRWVCLL